MPSTPRSSDAAAAAAGLVCLCVLLDASITGVDVDSPMTKKARVSYEAGLRHSMWLKREGLLDSPELSKDKVC